MNYCTQCGHALDHRVPPGDDRKRHLCPSCGFIHYQNPRIVIGCVPEMDDGRILLCRRAIAPREGYWTLPAGFMENGETCAEGAARETREEACARVEIGEPIALIDVPNIHQVHLMYRAKLLLPGIGPNTPNGHAAGPESLETRLVTEADIPWDELAFGSVRFTLECFFADRKENKPRFHQTRISYNRL